MTMVAYHQSLVNYLKTHELNIFDYLDKNKSLKVPDDDFKNPTSLTTINQNVLMCQTGYLTLRFFTYRIIRMCFGYSQW